MGTATANQITRIEKRQRSLLWKSFGVGRRYARRRCVSRGCEWTQRSRRGVRLRTRRAEVVPRANVDGARRRRSTPFRQTRRDRSRRDCRLCASVEREHTWKDFQRQGVRLPQNESESFAALVSRTRAHGTGIVQRRIFFWEPHRATRLRARRQRQRIRHERDARKLRRQSIRVPRL